MNKPTGNLPHTTSSPLETLAHQLEASGDYKILRRLKPRTPAPQNIATSKVGIVIDLETTGLDSAKDEIIELGMVKFGYSDADEITHITGVFQSLHQPSIPIPAEVTTITGITDAMVAGHRIDDAAVAAFVADANIVIAHNAGFDRKFAERLWPAFIDKPWACSMKEVDWKSQGLSGTRLSYLLADAGLFHEAHRAVDDCHALIEILNCPLGQSGQARFAALLAQARRNTVRIWAEGSPFELKDVLKKKGYRWSDGTDGSPRAWFVDVDEEVRTAELEFLRREIYQREIDLRFQMLTAKERHSARI